MSPVLIISLCASVVGMVLFLVLWLKKKVECRDLEEKVNYLTENNERLNQDLVNERNRYKHYVDFSIPTEAKSIIICTDANGVITSVNSYAEEFYGYTKKEMVGKDAVGLIIPQIDSKSTDMRNLFHRIAENPKVYVDYENEGMKKSGEKVWISWANHTLHDDGKIKEIRLVGFDVTAKHKMENEMFSLSYLDKVTGVFNKQNILDTANDELKRSVRYSRAFSIVVVRLQGVAGSSGEIDDDFLKKIALACVNVTRNSDSVGRISDNEFLIVLPETPIANVSFLLHRLRSKLNTIVGESGKKVDVLMGASDQKYTDDNIAPVVTRAINNLKM